MRYIKRLRSSNATGFSCLWYFTNCYCCYYYYWEDAAAESWEAMHIPVVEKLVAAAIANQVEVAHPPWAVVQIAGVVQRNAWKAVVDHPSFHVEAATTNQVEEVQHRETEEADLAAAAVESLAVDLDADVVAADDIVLRQTQGADLRLHLLHVGCVDIQDCYCYC